MMLEVKIPNILAIDEPINSEIHKSDYPTCLKNCSHCKRDGKCNGCNNYEYDIFWKEDKAWNGIKRKA